MRWRAVVRAKPGIITPSRRRGNHGVHRTDTVHRPPGRRVAERSDLQPSDHRPPVSPGSGSLAERRAASDPNLYPSYSARGATLELEASGGLTVEVNREANAAGRPIQTRNHRTLKPEWEP
jgi:hypothetical protein